MEIARRGIQRYHNADTGQGSCKMNEPFWLDVEILIDLHAEQLALFGGAGRLRDQGMLESALGRPINKWSL